MTDDRLTALRSGFDEAFARPPVEPAGDVENLLVVRVAGDRYAFRLRALAGVARAGRIVPVPGPVAESLGLAAVGSTLVPAYRLGPFLGYPEDRDPPRWLVVCGGNDARAALGVGHFEGWADVDAADVAAADDRTRREHVREVVRTAAGVCGVVDVRSVLEAVGRRAAAAARGEGVTP